MQAATGDPETGIVTSLPKDFVRKFWRELEGKLPEERVKVHLRQREQAKTMQQLGSTKMNGLGQLVSKMDSRLFFRLYQEQQAKGNPLGEWLPEYLADNPHLCAKGYRPKVNSARHGLTGGWLADKKAS